MTGLLGVPKQYGLLGANPVYSVQQTPVAQAQTGQTSMMQGLLNNPQFFSALGAGLLQAGAPSTDPGSFGRGLSQAMSEGSQALMQQAEDRRQQEALDGLAQSGQFTPQQTELLKAFPGQAAQAAATSAFAQAKTPGTVNMINPKTGDIKTVREDQADSLAKFGYVLTGNYETPKDNSPNSIREYEAAVGQGYQGSYMDFLSERKQGTTVNLNNPPTPPAGYQNVYDDMGRLVRQDVIPGGPADKERIEALAAQEKGDTQKVAQADIVNDEISRALSAVQKQPDLTTGIGGTVSSMVPGSTAMDVSENLRTISAAIGFDKLQAMREASPTGGALGAVSEMETKLLQSVFGSLSQSQSPEQFTYNLKRLANTYNDIVHGPGNGPQRYGLQTQQAPAEGYDPLGILGPRNPGFGG